MIMIAKHNVAGLFDSKAFCPDVVETKSICHRYNNIIQYGIESRSGRTNIGIGRNVFLVHRPSPSGARSDHPNPQLIYGM